MWNATLFVVGLEIFFFAPSEVILETLFWNPATGRMSVLFHFAKCGRGQPVCRVFQRASVGLVINNRNDATQ